MPLNVLVVLFCLHVLVVFRVSCSVLEFFSVFFLPLHPLLLISLLLFYYHFVTSIIVRLALRAGKTNQIARCDWLPKWARWSHLARSGLPAVSRKQNFTKSHMINPLLAKFVRSRWLDIASLLTSTSSWSINMQKKNLANIPPS